jgi:hypothetical protein
MTTTDDDEIEDEHTISYAETSTEYVEYVKRDETSRKLAKEFYHTNYMNLSPRKMIINRPKDDPFKSLWKRILMIGAVFVAAVFMTIARSADFVVCFIVFLCSVD